MISSSGDGDESETPSGKAPELLCNWGQIGDGTAWYSQVGWILVQKYVSLNKSGFYLGNMYG